MTFLDMSALPQTNKGFPLQASLKKNLILGPSSPHEVFWVDPASPNSPWCSACHLSLLFIALAEQPWSKALLYLQLKPLVGASGKEGSTAGSAF